MLTVLIRSFLLFGFLAGVRGADMPSLPDRLPHTNLLVYHARDGKVSKVKSVRDWQKRRAEIVRGMELIMGPLPGESKRCPLEMRVEVEKDCGDYDSPHQLQFGGELEGPRLSAHPEKGAAFRQKTSRHPRAPPH